MLKQNRDIHIQILIQYLTKMAEGLQELAEAPDAIPTLAKINTFARAVINQTETMGGVLGYFPSEEIQTTEDQPKQTAQDLPPEHI